MSSVPSSVTCVWGIKMVDQYDPEDTSVTLYSSEVIARKALKELIGDCCDPKYSVEGDYVMNDRGIPIYELKTWPINHE